MQLITSSAILFSMINIILMVMYFRKKPICPKCPEQEPCKIDNIGIPSVRIIPELDLQFSENNLPSRIYEDVFTGPNIWIGGFQGEAAMNAGRSVIKKTL